MAATFSRRGRARIILAWALAAAFLAACSGGGSSTPTPDEGPVRLSSTMPSPPAWTEAASPITLQNITQARYLGRLDTFGELSTVFSHALSPDSTRLAGLNNELLLGWDLITGQVLFGVNRQEAIYVLYSSDKTELYTVNPDGFVLIYDAETGVVKNSFQGHTQFSGVLAYNLDLDLLALGGIDGEVKVWSTFERTSLVTFTTPTIEVSALAFSPDGAVLIVGGIDGNVEAWNWRERQRLSTLDHGGEYIVRATFSLDGSRLAVGGNDTVRLWDADYSLLHVLQTGAGGASDVLLFSPDGRYLVNGGVIPDMLVWDVISGQRLALLPGVGGDRVSAAFSPDGDLLLTSVLDGSVALWNMESITGQTIGRADLDVATSRVLYVDWTPDGFLMTFFDSLGPIHVWGVGQ